MANIYETPPVWFTRNKHNKDAVLSLTKAGWIATFPNGRTEIVVAMKNVPTKYLGEKATVTAEAVPAPAPAEQVVEVPEAPAQEDEVEAEAPVEEAPKKKRSKKNSTNE